MFVKRVVTCFFVCILVFVSYFGHAQKYKFSGEFGQTIDSLQLFLKTSKEDITKVNTINILSRQYINTGNYEKALQYAEDAQQQSGKLSYQKGIADSYNNIGIIYWHKGDYEKSVDYHLKALKIREEIGDKKGIAYCYNNIGIIYMEHENFEKALVFFLKSLKILEIVGEKKEIALAINNIGYIYWNQGLYEKALDNQLRSLKIHTEIGDKHGIAYSQNCIGLIYFSQGNYEKALNSQLESLKIDEEMQDKQRIGNDYINIGSVYIKQGKLEKSNYYFNEALIISQKIGNKEGIKGAYFSLSELFDKRGDYKQAYNYHKLYSDIKDTLLNKQSSKQIAEMNAKYDSEKKDKENMLLAQKNRIQQIEIEREKEKRYSQLIILVGSLTFAVVVFILLYYRSKFKQKAMMEKEINSQQKLRFKAVMDAEEKERRRIAQELHDGLGQLLSTVKLNISATENLIDEVHKTPFNNSLSLIDTACDEVRTISHNLMPGVLIRLGLLSSLRELVRKINASKQLTINFDANFDARIDELTEVAIYRIVQEVLNNIIKHSQAKNVSLALKKNGADFFMQIIDDGIGFDTSLIVKSEGVGWKNIYSRSAMLNGTVDIISAPFEGMTVKIYFPILFSENII